MRLKQIAYLMAQNVPQIVSIGLTRSGTILVGKRRDSGKWTFPGGHMEDGEIPQEAALRELREETGISLNGLQFLRAQEIAGQSGRQIAIYAFTAESHGQVPFVNNDPDKEFSEFKWVPLSLDTPELLPENRHNPRDVILEALCGGNGSP